MGIRCWIFGHDFERPADARRGRANFKVCSHCRRVMTRDYYDGWKRASPTERAYYLHIFDTMHDRVEQRRRNDDLSPMTAARARAMAAA